MEKQDIQLNAYAPDSDDTITVRSASLYEEGALDPVYEAKTRTLNRAIQEIGMGKYQYTLFVVAGFGWFADSVWPLITGLILTPVVAEFNFNGPFLSLAANVGLLVGAVFWGLGCDIWGRKWCFNVTLFIAGVFGLASGGSPNLLTLASLIAVLGIGVGGNLPVDSAVFLDLVPASHQFLLTTMSVFWSLGQLFVSLVAWPLIANFSCPLTTSPDGTCTRKENMGWRYLLFLLGGLTLVLWAFRFFAVDLLESPRYLVGRGRDEDAVLVVQKVAKINGKECHLTVDDLRVDGEKGGWLSQTSNFTKEHFKALFRTRKMAWSTSLLVLLWGIIGLASTLYNNFLPFLLASRGAHFGDTSLSITYRNQAILATIGVPSAFIAGWAVELPAHGRFLFASTTARSSNALLGWNCGYVFWSNIMYGVLYAVSPEVFPAKDRGTGNGVFGVLAPIIALYANLSTAVPVYIAGALIILAGGMALLLPYEPRGKAAM
ncbi:major facilitator superfamily domain-containing protein [Cyathus striatus]|nr:major facilitator superfamily domain-containing protein [Cyathus striatus]